MKIRRISIESVRGISSKEICCNINPNTPTFFVAPNGFGKSSIATAFNSMNRNRIELQDDDKFQNNQEALPELKITDETGNVYYANSTSNTISDIFSIGVINSQVKPKATNRNFGKFSSSTSTLVVEPIILYNSIPNRSEFTYSFLNMKHQLGVSAGKLILNLKDKVKDPVFVRHFSTCKNDIARLKQVRNNGKFSAFLNMINETRKSSDEIINCTVDTTDLLGNKSVSKIIDEFSYLFNDLSINEKLVNVVQLRELYYLNEKHISDIIKYYEFINDRDEINEILGFFNCTWKSIKAARKGHKFIIEFPKANQISNGERDVLCFIGKLFETRSKFRKDKAILIIDEIFDYLDDANLIAAQYFLTKFISYFKTNGKELFLIILTHLDPTYFNTYSFSIKNIFYLDCVEKISNKYKINNLLKDRDNCKKKDQALYNRISSNYLHYSVNNTVDATYMQCLKVEPELFTPTGFRQKVFEELSRYKSNSEYDPVLVCCGLRIFIEKSAYEQLSEEHQTEFLLTYTTTDKLIFAKEKGAKIPEVHFLLSIIYNEAMHLDPQCQKINPISCKLRNKVIHNMIVEL